MQQKVLTVTIPTWNRAKLLEELLSELIEQIISDNLHNKIEILISNNGSEDETESLVLTLKSKHNFITYNNNGINKGARYNVLKCMELANAEYLMLLGDDDRPKKGSLKKIINFLEANPKTGSLYDSHLFKRNPFGDSVIFLAQLLENFFYYLGNAGLFIIKSQYIKDVLKSHSYDFFNPTWPQTQILILAGEQNSQDEIRICDLDIVSEGKHDEVMIYSSYYLIRGLYFDLADAISDIKNEISSECYLSARTYLKNNLSQTTFNILQCGVYVDDSEVRKKTILYIKSNLQNYSLKEKIYLFLIIFALSLPVQASRLLSDIFIFATKGKKGINKKNKFVQLELEKLKNKKNKNKAVRTFEF